MTETITSVLAILANVWLDIIGFFTNLFIEKNYIALEGILVGFVLLGIAIGTIKTKIKRTKRF